jgi:hypothetical protein
MQSLAINTPANPEHTTEMLQSSGEIYVQHTVRFMFNIPCVLCSTYRAFYVQHTVRFMLNIPGVLCSTYRTFYVQHTVRFMFNIPCVLCSTYRAFSYSPRFCKNDKIPYTNQNKITIRHISYQVPTATCLGTKASYSGSFSWTKDIRTFCCTSWKRFFNLTPRSLYPWAHYALTSYQDAEWAPYLV